MSYHSRLSALHQELEDWTLTRDFARKEYSQALGAWDDEKAATARAELEQAEERIRQITIELQAAETRRRA